MEWECIRIDLYVTTLDIRNKDTGCTSAHTISTETRQLYKTVPFCCYVELGHGQEILLTVGFTRDTAVTGQGCTTTIYRACGRWYAARGVSTRSPCGLFCGPFLQSLLPWCRGSHDRWCRWISRFKNSLINQSSEFQDRVIIFIFQKFIVAARTKYPSTFQQNGPNQVL